MIGSRSFLLGAVIFFVSANLKAANTEELIKFIDQRNYAEVLKYFPEKPSGAEANLILKAHAQLGLSGFEPLELISRIRNPQVFSQALLKEYFELSKCPNNKLENRFDGPLKCAVLRFFNHVPHHTSQQLLQARETFRLILSNGSMGRQDRFLYCIVELSIVMSKLREVLYMYNAIDPIHVTKEEADQIFLLIRSAGEDMESFIKQYKDLKVIFNHKFFGTKDAFLLEETADAKIQFLQKSGLPMFFRVTDLERETTTELAGRNIIIQIIDRADNFFRTALEGQ